MILPVGVFYTFWSDKGVVMLRVTSGRHSYCATPILDIRQVVNVASFAARLSFTPHC